MFDPSVLLLFESQQMRFQNMAYKNIQCPSTQEMTSAFRKPQVCPNMLDPSVLVLLEFQQIPLRNMALGYLRACPRKKLRKMTFRKLRACPKKIHRLRPRTSLAKTDNLHTSSSPPCAPLHFIRIADEREMRISQASFCWGVI